MPLTHADKYSIIKLLGRGDVGRVFLVEEKVQ
jgi:hypothetical protein